MTYCGPMSCPQNDPQGEICFKVECNQGIPYPSISQWPESTIEEDEIPDLNWWPDGTDD